MKQKFPDVPTIAITGCSDIGIAVQLLKNDACDFVMKRFNLVIVQEFTRIALEKTRVDMEMRQLRRSLRQGYALGGMLSRTPQGASNIRNHSRGSTHRFEGYD